MRENVEQMDVLHLSNALRAVCRHKNSTQRQLSAKDALCSNTQSRKDTIIKPQMRIIFNPEFSRYEVYREEPICRNGQPQPIFVSHDEKECRQFAHRVKKLGEEVKA